MNSNAYQVQLSLPLDQIHAELIDPIRGAIEAIQSGNFSLSLIKTDQALNAKACIIDLHTIRALAFIGLGKFAEASVALLEELRFFPNNPAALKLLKDLKADPRCGGIRLLESDFSERLSATAHSCLYGLLQRNLVSPSLKIEVAQSLLNMAPDHWHSQDILCYQQAAYEGAQWFDLPTTLRWWARHMQPQNYLEVGVRRGRSLIQVALQSKNTRLFAIDNWTPKYSSIPESEIYCENPGPELIFSEFTRCGLNNLPHILGGDSVDSLRSFFTNPNYPKAPDLITIDADKSYGKACIELGFAFTHIAPGGAILFSHCNDLDNPGLRELWLEYKSRFTHFFFIEDLSGVGTGLALRPPFRKLFDHFERNPFLEA